MGGARVALLRPGRALHVGGVELEELQEDEDAHGHELLEGFEGRRPHDGDLHGPRRAQHVEQGKRQVQAARVAPRVARGLRELPEGAAAERAARRRRGLEAEQERAGPPCSARR